DFQDIVSLQTVASLVRRGVKPDDIQRSLTNLADILPGTERPLAQLQIVAAEPGELLAQVGEALIAPDGQQMLPFECAAGATAAGGAVEIEPKPGLALSEDAFARADEAPAPAPVPFAPVLEPKPA